MLRAEPLEPRDVPAAWVGDPAVQYLYPAGATGPVWTVTYGEADGNGPAVEVRDASPFEVFNAATGVDNRAAYVAAGGKAPDRLLATIDVLGDPAYRGGIKVTSVTVDPTGRGDLVAVPNNGSRAVFLTLDPTTAAVTSSRSVWLYGPDYAGGISYLNGADTTGDGFGELTTVAGPRSHLVSLDARTGRAVHSLYLSAPTDPPDVAAAFTLDALGFIFIPGLNAHGFTAYAPGVPDALRFFRWSDGSYETAGTVRERYDLLIGSGLEDPASVGIRA